MNRVEKIQREIRKRAFKRVDARLQETQIRQQTRHTLDALQEVTGLPRPELDTVAGQTITTFDVQERFFSIKQQLLLAVSTLIPLVIGLWLLVAWVR